MIDTVQGVFGTKVHHASRSASVSSFAHHMYAQSRPVVCAVMCDV